MKSNKGAVTLYVILAMLTLSAFLMAIYIRNANAEAIQLETTAKIKETYESYDFNEVYETLKNEKPVIKGYSIEGKNLTIETYTSNNINVDQNGKKILYYAVTSTNTAPIDIGQELGKWQNSNVIDISNIESEDQIYIWIKNEDNIVSGFQKRQLPSEYQQVDYIESTGTQYINTEMTCNENLRIDAKYYVSSLELDRNYIFGVYGSDNGYRVQYSHGNVIFAGFGDMYNNSIEAPQEDKTYTLTLDDGKFILDGEEIYDATNANLKYSSGNDKTIMLFATNSNGTINYCSSIKLYSYKIYLQNTIVRDLIPCYRKTDGVIGMYDMVNNKFYTNSGTGTFLKGNNV